jgi:hypothetical protein
MNDELEEIKKRLNIIQGISFKLWKAKHYRWANTINWEVMRIKDWLKIVEFDLKQK